MLKKLLGLGLIALSFSQPASARLSLKPDVVTCSRITNFVRSTDNWGTVDYINARGFQLDEPRRYLKHLRGALKRSREISKDGIKAARDSREEQHWTTVLIATQAFIKSADLDRNEPVRPELIQQGEDLMIQISVDAASISKSLLYQYSCPGILPH